MHETGYFEGPYCEVAFLHWNKDYIFELSIPVASFSFEYCIGAMTVPWPKVAPNFRKFVSAALYGNAWNRVLWRSVLRGGLFALNQGLHFWLSIPVVSFWYKYCVGAITVPWPKVAPNFREFVQAALYGDALNRVLWRSVLRGGLFARITFWTLHSRSFLFI